MGQENVVLEAFQLGADDYITKPFSPNEFSMRVRRYIPEKVMFNNDLKHRIILILPKYFFRNKCLYINMVLYFFLGSWF